MVLEIVAISIKPGSEKGFTDTHAAVTEEAGPVEGMLSARLTQGVETPTNFVLLVEWADLAAHERYRETEEYGQWRAAVAPFAAGPASVQHTRVVA